MITDDYSLEGFVFDYCCCCAAYIGNCLKRYKEQGNYCLRCNTRATKNAKEVIHTRRNIDLGAIINKLLI